MRGKAEGITVRRGEAEEGRGLQLRRREVKERGAVREEVQTGRVDEVKVRRKGVEGRQAAR